MRFERKKTLKRIAKTKPNKHYLSYFNVSDQAIQTHEANYSKKKSGKEAISLYAGYNNVFIIPLLVTLQLLEI